MSSICKARYSNRKRWLQSWQKPTLPSALAVLLATLLWGTLMLTGCGHRHEMPIDMPPQRVAISEDAARRLSERVSKALQTPGPLRLDLTEEELASFLALHSQGLPLEGLAIRLARGQIWFWAKIKLWNHPALHGQLGLTCDRGRIQVHLNQAWLNGHRLPRFLLASVEKAANDALSDIQLRLQVEHITLDDGAISITGEVN